MSYYVPNKEKALQTGRGGDFEFKIVGKGSTLFVL
jgi:hypothetical protein